MWTTPFLLRARAELRTRLSLEPQPPQHQQWDASYITLSTPVPSVIILAHITLSMETVMMEVQEASTLHCATGVQIVQIAAADDVAGRL